MSAVAKAFVVDIQGEQISHRNGADWIRVLMRSEDLLALHRALDELVRGVE